jgi:hypothetical protein
MTYYSMTYLVVLTTSTLSEAVARSVPSVLTTMVAMPEVCAYTHIHTYGSIALLYGGRVVSYDHYLLYSYYCISPVCESREVDQSV